MDNNRAKIVQAIFLIALAGSIVCEALLTYVKPMLNA